MWISGTQPTFNLSTSFLPSTPKIHSETRSLWLCIPTCFLAFLNCTYIKLGAWFVCGWLQVREPRKGWDVLLKAYWSEFTPSDNTLLVIKTSYHNYQKNFKKAALAVLNSMYPATSVTVNAESYCPYVQRWILRRPTSLPFWSSMKWFLLPFLARSTAGQVSTSSIKN